jgi:hypothetical protein
LQWRDSATGRHVSRYSANFHYSAIKVKGRIDSAILNSRQQRVQHCGKHDSLMPRHHRGITPFAMEARMLRSALLGTVFVLMASPAMAADAPSRTSREVGAMAETLNRPEMQSAIAGGLGAMISALLDIRVDGIAKALEPVNGGKRVKMGGDTLREIAAKDDPNFEPKLQGQTRAAVSGLGAMATALASAMPELEAAMEKMSDAMETAKDRLPRAELH